MIPEMWANALVERPTVSVKLSRWTRYQQLDSLIQDQDQSYHADQGNFEPRILCQYNGHVTNVRHVAPHGSHDVASIQKFLPRWVEFGVIGLIIVASSSKAFASEHSRIWH